MLPEHFYLTGTGWLGYIVYLPVALIFIGIIYGVLLRRIPQQWLKWSVTGVLAIVLGTFPLWEALAISYEAEKLCKEQGGLHVYKTVETDGFLGSGSITYWSKYGFNYIEGGCGKYGRSKCRKTIQNGEEVREEIPEFTSRYHSRGGKHKKLNNYFAQVRYYVEDRQTQEVLGELVKIKIYPSRFDIIVLSLLPVEYNPWLCGDEAPKGVGSYNRGKKKYVYNSNHVVKATLKPKR